MRKVEIVAPSGKVLCTDDIAKVASYFEKRGWSAKLASGVYDGYQRFAGKNDQKRLEEFNHATVDKGNDLVLSARGGYGMNRILPHIEFDRIYEKGTWVAGFSDITLFSLAYLAKVGGRSLHAPTASVLGKEATDPWTISEFFRALTVRKYGISFPTVAQDFYSEGILWGGNLTVLTSLLGTEFFPKIKGGILFLEDVGEPAYKIERCLLQLVQSGVISQQSCVILGDFTGIRYSGHDFGYNLDEALNYFLSLAKKPVIKGLPFGHTERMCTLVIGSKASIEVSDRVAKLVIYDGPELI